MLAAQTVMVLATLAVAATLDKWKWANDDWVVRHVGLVAAALVLILEPSIIAGLKRALGYPKQEWGQRRASNFGPETGESRTSALRRSWQS
jgi:hypothetical protein